MEYYSADALLRYFENEIASHSAKEIDEILREVVAVKSKELAKIEIEVKQQVALSQGVRLKEIRDAQRAEINRMIADRNQKLAARRREIADDIFDEVRKRLAGFVGSPAYLDHVAEKAAKSAELLGSQPMRFYLSADDASGRETIERAFGTRATVKADPAIRIGGFRVVGLDSGLEIDETLDTRLSQNREWFYANSQLFIRL